MQLSFSWIGPWIATVVCVLMLSVGPAWAGAQHEGSPGWTIIESQFAEVAANPQNPTAWNNLGQLLFFIGQTPEALLAYDHALMLNPDYSLVLANRCGVLSQLESYQMALQSCDMAIEIDHLWGAQGAALAWDNRGDVLFRLEDYQASLASFDQALAVNPDYQNARRNREVVLAQLEKANTR
ncbi:MAG: tetratricopeptide repeat protein [Cyanobacteria bacterium J06632_22]